MQFLFAALVFLIIILIFGGIYAFTGQEKQRDIIRGRLEAIEKGAAIRQECLEPGPDPR